MKDRFMETLSKKLIHDAEKATRESFPLGIYEPTIPDEILANSDNK